MSRHQFVVHPLVLRTLEVVSVCEVTPRMRRVRLAGAELSGFRRDGLDLAGFDAPGFDDHVKLIFAADGDLTAALPRQLAEGIEWTDAPSRESRDYTPRAVDPAAGWLDLDFVLHGDGPAATWARSAEPGDELAMVGPKSSLVLPEETTGILLVGDETALPAIGRFLDERPIAVPAHVLVVLEDPGGRQDLAVGPEDSIRFVEQDPRDAEALLRAVRERVDGLGGLDALGEHPFVWAAGESAALLPLRRWAGRENGLARSQQSITGYWHVSAGSGESATAVQGGSLPVPPVVWFAVRAALELGLLDGLRDRPATSAELSESTGAARAALTVLIDLLREEGLIAASEAAAGASEAPWQLTARGRNLVDDEHAREHYEGLEAERLIALADLPDALRGGEAAWRLRHGRSFATSVDEDAAWSEESVEDAGSLRFLQHGLLRALEDLPVIAGRRGTVALLGPGAEVVADLLAVRGDERLVVRAHDAASPVPGQADAAVSVLRLHMLEDDEAVAHLRELRSIAPEVIVIAAARPDALGGATAARSLLTVAETAVPPRDADALARLAQRAGWGLARTDELGWGIAASRLLPEDPLPEHMARDTASGVTGAFQRP